MKDYYKILGVSRNASKDEIKRAFRKLAMEHHPDRGGNPEKFKEISEAYSVLSDDVKRRHYDQYGTVFDNMAGAGGFTGFEGFDFSDIFQGFSEDIGRGFDIGDIFSEFFGGTSRRKSSKRRGHDISIDLRITLEEAFEGLEREIELKKLNRCEVCEGKGAAPGSDYKSCPECNGKGFITETKRTFFGVFSTQRICVRCAGTGRIPEKICSECKGNGRIEKIKKIKIVIPAGVHNEQIIKIKGEGEAGGYGAEDGDLYVKIHIAPHKIFTRKDDDLYTEIEVKLTTLILGGKISIPSISVGEEIIVNIPELTNIGEVLKINSKGFRKFNSTKRGDLYVKIKAKMPKKITRKIKDLLEELDKEIE